MKLVPSTLGGKCYLAGALWIVGSSVGESYVRTTMRDSPAAERLATIDSILQTGPQERQALLIERKQILSDKATQTYLARKDHDMYKTERLGDLGYIALITGVYAQLWSVLAQKSKRRS